MRFSPNSLQKLLPSLNARLRTYHLQNLPQVVPPLSSSPATLQGSTSSLPQSAQEEAIELAELELRWMGEAAKDWAALEASSLRVDIKGSQDTLASEGNEGELWGSKLVEMVADRVEKNKPLAYIIGAYFYLTPVYVPLVLGGMLTVP